MFLKGNVGLFNTIKNVWTFAPEDTYLEIYSSNVLNHVKNNIYMRLVITDCFLTSAKNQPKMPTKRLNEIGYIHMVAYYKDVKKEIQEF